MQKTLLKFTCCAVAGGFLLVYSVPVHTLAATASHKQAAEELVAAINSKQQMDQTIDAIADASFESVDDGPCMAGMQPKLKTFFHKHFSFEQQKPFLVDTYVQSFTEEELKQISGFYKTPVGQKTLEKMPQITQLSMQHTQQKMIQLQPEIEQLVLQHVQGNAQCADEYQE